MRRSRIKVAPNVGGLNRPAKPVKEEASSQVSSEIASEVSSVVTSIPTPSAENDTPPLSDATCSKENNAVNETPGQVSPSVSVPTQPLASEQPKEVHSNSGIKNPRFLRFGKPKARPNINPVKSSTPSQSNASEEPENSELSLKEQTPVSLAKEEKVEREVVSPVDSKNLVIENGLIPLVVSTTIPSPVLANALVPTHPALTVPPLSANTFAESENQNNLSVSRFLKSRLNKIRPVITKAAPHRVRTFSSASESEDEGKRQTRKPLVPVKKTKTKENEAENSTTEADEQSECKKKPEEKSQLEIRKLNMRKKFAKGQVGLDNMTMFDFIYYNPDGVKPARSKEKLETRRRTFESEAVSKKGRDDANMILEDRLNEEEEMSRMDEPSAEKDVANEQVIVTGEPVEEVDEEDEGAMPAPQVRLGPDGQIILDDMSLVIETTETKKNKKELMNAEIIVENGAGLVNYGSWRKRKRSSRWSLRETARFYRALSMLGTDFSLMENLFPNRSRFELKRKFKVEEKCNQDLIDRTIASQKPFDPTVFGNETDDDEISETESTASKKAKPEKVKKTAPKKQSKSVETAADAGAEPKPKRKYVRKPKSDDKAEKNAKATRNKQSKQKKTSQEMTELSQKKKKSSIH